MTNFEVLIRYLDGLQHFAKKRHWPDYLYFENAPLVRQCVRCLEGGHRTPRLPLIAVKARA